MKDPKPSNIDVDIAVEDIDSHENEFSPDLDSHPNSGNQNVLSFKKLTTNVTEETKASTLKKCRPISASHLQTVKSMKISSSASTMSKMKMIVAEIGLSSFY